MRGVVSPSVIRPVGHRETVYLITSVSLLPEELRYGKNQFSSFQYPMMMYQKLMVYDVVAEFVPGSGETAIFAKFEG